MPLPQVYLKSPEQKNVIEVNLHLSHSLFFVAYIILDPFKYKIDSLRLIVIFNVIFKQVFLKK